MSDLFVPIAAFAGIPPAVLPGAASYDACRIAAGTWPAPFGPSAKNSRSAEPLLHDAWRVRWQAPLDAARHPESVLVGAGLVVVNGSEQRGIWDRNGTPTALLSRGMGTSYLDVAAKRLLTGESGGGLGVHPLPSGSPLVGIFLTAPITLRTDALLAGPDALVIINTHDSPFGESPCSIVESIRITDYDRTKNGILYGLEPLGGIVREQDGRIRAAAASRGPVLATREGVVWCDWQAHPIAEHRMTGTPVSLSVDDQQRACLIVDDGSAARLAIIPPGGPVAANVGLPWESDPDCPPPIIAPNGTMYLTPRDHVLALTPTGDQLWMQTRNSAAPGTVTSNGLLLLSDDQLYAVTSDGRRFSLWEPPEALVTAAVLAGDLLHVCSAETLYVLEPVN